MTTVFATVSCLPLGIIALLCCQILAAESSPLSLKPSTRSRSPRDTGQLHSSTQSDASCCSTLQSVINGQSNKLPLNCYDARQMGQKVSGIYKIDPHDGEGPFRVYCDMTTDGGGWTVFQRRQDGSEDFFLKWNEYKNGFGDLMGEFWLGLDKIHRLTAHQTLRVDLADFDGAKRFAQYQDFTVGNEKSKYVMNIGKYLGNAGDSLTATHSGQKFSTSDNDNDEHDINCAVANTGAWWYKGCHSANLNGQYLKGVITTFNGVSWTAWRGVKYSLKFSEMKIRPNA